MRRLRSMALACGAACGDPDVENDVVDDVVDVPDAPIEVDPARFETSLPGVYAVGDLVHYQGKKKLILCGFHEATLATFAALARLRPEAPTLLQYTTTSTLLQQRLGVSGAAAAGDKTTG